MGLLQLLLQGALAPPAQVRPEGQEVMVLSLLQKKPEAAAQEERMGGLEPPAHTLPAGQGAPPSPLPAGQ